LRTQTAIIGAGPAGLLLSQLLYRQGIDAVVLERRSAAHVAGRIRAGVIEQGTVELLHEAGVGGRLAREGLVHRGFNLGFAGHIERIDIHGLTGGRTVVVYGQTEITRDLMDAHAARDASVFYEVDGVRLDDLDSESPSVTFSNARGEHRISCDFVAGCDGFHGVSRTVIPESALTTYEKVYPFAWLGVLADVPPCDDEIIYSTHERGFALASMRSHTRSRYYVQCAPDERLDEWSDERFWNEVSLRLGPTAAARITRGPAIEKSLAPVRSFVAEPMRYGRLFLAGDAAHIVPPTGAKGLNLAASDVHYLSEGLVQFYRTGSSTGLDAYSSRALARVWRASRFSWQLTSLLHCFPDADAFGRRMQSAELAYIRSSPCAKAVLAENYAGLPL
jgi:p-hydroxybenzoate 3-monooxygenase